MTVSYLKYPLRRGYVGHWLVAGPHANPVPDLSRFEGDDFKLQIAREYYQENSRITGTPAEQASTEIDGEIFTWRYVRCGDDHFVDLSGFYHTCHHLSAWAFAQLTAPAPQEATFVLTTNGPADIWLNGQHVHRQEHFHHQLPRSVSFRAALQKRSNDILVRFEAVAVREYPYVMALQLADPPAQARVRLPTTVQPVERRQQFERTFELAYLDWEVYSSRDALVVRWPETFAEERNIAVRLQDPAGPIYAEQWAQITADAKAVQLGRSIQTPDGAYHLVLMPQPKEYYEGKMRIQRQIKLNVLKNAYSYDFYGTDEQRRVEALEDAARREQNVFSEIAKMALGRWDRIKTETIRETMDRINQRADCSDFYMTGLLGMAYRYRDDPAFPEELKAPLEACILNFKYWLDEPGRDAMCYWSENHQILFHTCEILAGQLYPDQTFSNAGQSGRWHQEKGERMALSWLRKRAGGGFREWDSNCYFEHDVLALSHLVDLAETNEVREMAAVILDKLLFTMALNSYRGVFGSTHGRTYSPYIKGGRLEPTAGVSRLLWGMGIFNQHILGTVSLACAESYELPSIIQAIAISLPEEIWSKERHAGTLEEWCDLASGDWEVNKVTYKTPDYMLCSAQDYRPGQPGYQQHIWQATLGSDAVVFVNHPPCISQEGAHRPNFWHGNVTLPRVAQWKDILIGVYNLPPDDWLGFTHAYFPARAFDEYTLRAGWAFARQGNGYLALAAAQGLEFITEGDSAYRELRSHGLQNVWLCHMGRAVQDGSFAEFQEKILALKVAFEPLAVGCPTLRGQTLRFGWEGPFLVDGQEQPVADFTHYDSPYCTAEPGAPEMEIRFDDYGMRLHFG